MVAAVSAALKAATMRRSGEIASIFASAIPRSTIDSKRWISSPLVGSATIHPFLAYCSKLTFVSEEEELFSAQHGTQEMIPAAQFRFEFRTTVQGRIPRGSQYLFRLGKWLDQLFQFDLTDDHHINVACCVVVLAGYRSIYESNLDLFRKWLERHSEHLERAHRFTNDGPQFGKNGIVPVRPVKNLVSYFGALNQSSIE